MEDRKRMIGDKALMRNLPGIIEHCMSKHISETSTTAKERLTQVQEQTGRPGLKMITEVDTRWNSTCNMLDRLYQLREPVGAALTSLKTDVTPPTALEYEAVQDALDVLAPLRQDTVELSGEKRVSASKVIPLMKMLNHAVTSKLEDLDSNLTRQWVTALCGGSGNMQYI
ncbi:unnamed protein product [Leuciscus chuanchicus]